MAKGHKDKVAVITGAAGGIGQAFAKRLAEDGVHVAIADVGDGAATVKMVQAAGREAIAVKCDVSSEDSVAAMTKQVNAKFSHVDIVVNCAGIFPQKDFSEMTFADWRKVLSINLDGDGITVNAIAPGLTRAPGTVVRAPRPTVKTMDEEFEAVAQMQAIKRVEVPEDLVGAISFLTSDDASFITGQTLNVDGGRVRS